VVEDENSECCADKKPIDGCTVMSRDSGLGADCGMRGSPRQCRYNHRMHSSTTISVGTELQHSKIFKSYSRLLAATSQPASAENARDDRASESSGGTAVLAHREQLSL
jgi:hypothetical protein